MTRISYHNCDEDHQLRCHTYFCSTAQVRCPLLVLADKEIAEKRKTAQSSRHSTISLNLSILFKHFSQFSSLSRMFPNPRLPLRLLNEDIMLLLFCPLCQSLLTSCAHILFNYIVATVIENSSSSSQDFLEVSGLKRYSATDNLTFNRCGNQRHLKKEAWGGNVG